LVAGGIQMRLTDVFEPHDLHQQDALLGGGRRDFDLAELQPRPSFR
jgi:hypothetical protein